MQLSPDQQRALDAIDAWFQSDEQSLTMGGYAGTGKTTIISHLLKQWKKLDIAVCAFTGKAASVLRSKGVHGATTMHKLIYEPVDYCKNCMCVVNTVKVPVDEAEPKAKQGDLLDEVDLPPPEKEGKFQKVCAKCNTEKYLKVIFVKVPLIEADLVIVDEASMLSLRLVEDLEELARKILYVGDHGQLEPIGKDPGIMHSPQIRLEQIHRQAEGSPIIQFAHFVRTNHHPRKWQGAAEAIVHRRPKASPQMLAECDVVLCGYNKTRVAVNKAIRRHRGFSDELPEIGERVICLQNDSDLGLFNGLLLHVEGRRGQRWGSPKFDFVDAVGNRYLDMRIYPEQFNQEKKPEHVRKGTGLFDFGYALTTHKAQGSEFNRVAVLEQIAGSWNPSRWRYTAATRAAQRLEYWLPR